MYRKYNGSAIRALLDVFPDIGLDQTKFTIVPRKLLSSTSPSLSSPLLSFSLLLISFFVILSKSDHYWKNVDNRRNFFIEVARSKGFDALVAQSWYSKANRTALLTERVF